MYQAILSLSLVFLTSYKIVIHYVVNHFKFAKTLTTFFYICIPAISLLLFVENGNQTHFNLPFFFDFTIPIVWYFVGFVLGATLFFASYFFLKTNATILQQKIVLKLDHNQTGWLIWLVASSEEVVYRYVIINAFFVLTNAMHPAMVLLPTFFFALNNFRFYTQPPAQFVIYLLLGLLIGFLAYFTNFTVGLITHYGYNLAFLGLFHLETKRSKKLA